MATPLRNVRIDDDLWNRAQARADNEGRALSAVIRDLLREYVDRVPAPIGPLD